MFAAGCFVMPVQATTMTIVQQGTTDATRGRVAGALNAAIQAASIGSMAAAGILADVIGIRAVFAVGGGITLLAAVLAWALFRGAPAARHWRRGQRVPGGGRGAPARRRLMRPAPDAPLTSKRRRPWGPAPLSC